MHKNSTAKKRRISKVLFGTKYLKRKFIEKTKYLKIRFLFTYVNLSKSPNSKYE